MLIQYKTLERISPFSEEKIIWVHFIPVGGLPKKWGTGVFHTPVPHFFGPLTTHLKHTQMI